MIATAAMRREFRHYVVDGFGTQRAFAKSLGVSDAYVSAIILGRKSMPVEWAAKIGYFPYQQWAVIPNWRMP